MQQRQSGLKDLGERSGLSQSHPGRRRKINRNQNVLDLHGIPQFPREYFVHMSDQNEGGVIGGLLIGDFCWDLAITGGLPDYYES